LSRRRSGARIASHQDTYRFNDYDKPVMTTPTLRPYADSDEDAAIELWRRTWAHHFPQIDFNARQAWWRERWKQELVPVAHVILADVGGKLTGFVTVDPKTRYLDQLVVAPEFWGSGVATALLDEAKRLSPDGLELLVNKDNLRAIRFYEKNGFAYAGEAENPVSGLPVNRMRWGMEG
jgi:putative acetyltransferase